MYRYNYSVRVPADVPIVALTNFHLTIQKAGRVNKAKKALQIC
jgi:hypothetical protein